nr:uncharacterized protein LOC129395852 isoform X5 [Pan paniscus]
MQGLARAGLAKVKGQGPPGPGQVRAAQARFRRVRGARERPAEGAREPGAARGGARAGPDAQLRAARTQQACAQTPQLLREAARAGCFFFPKCRQSPRSHGQPFRQVRSHWQALRQGWPAQEGGGRRPSLGEEAAAVAGGGKRTAPGLRGRGGRAAARQEGDRPPDRWRRQRRLPLGLRSGCGHPQHGPSGRGGRQGQVPHAAPCHNDLPVPLHCHARIQACPRNATRYSPFVAGSQGPQTEGLAEAMAEERGL